MQEKDFSILEVCLCCGFDNPNYFIDLFKKQIDMIPDAYKHILRGGKKEAVVLNNSPFY